MKRFISIILTVLLAVSMATPVFAAEAVKGTEANPYTFKEIPASWIKQTKKDNTTTGYTITVANNKKATFKLSGTQFKEYSVKGKDGKFGKAVALTNGKLRIIKNASVIKVVLRDKAEKKSTSDVPKVNVTTHYQSGMSRDEIHGDLNPLMKHGYAVDHRGNLVQSDKTTPTSISVRNAGVYITGWRRSKDQVGGTTMDTLENTRTIFNYFWKDAGDSLFLLTDEAFTSSEEWEVLLKKHGFTDDNIDGSKGLLSTLTHKSGVKIIQDCSNPGSLMYRVV